MIRKQDFSEDEWRLLRDLPVLAGFLVSIASESDPFGTMREITQTVEAVAQTARRYPDSDLVQSLASDFERSQADAAAGAMGGSADVSADPGRFRADVLEKCRSARAFLAVKAGEPEGRAYRNWILAVARSVAMASKEGGFLGIGGRPVSPEESAALQELAEVLGLEPDEATGEIRPEGSR